MTLDLPSWADPVRWEQQQRPVYEELCARFDEGHNLVLLDAPCGSGKSLLGYMVHKYLDVAALTLVGTKVLQDQYERTFPEIALIKGRANYIPLLVEHESWKDPTCGDCDLDDSRLCTYCGEPDGCPYLVARDIAASADIACTNMAYALGEWTSYKSKFRNRGLVILDEADTAAEEIGGHVSISISPQMQRNLGLRPPDKKTVESSWPAWFEYAVPHVKSHLSAMPNRTLEQKRMKSRVERLYDKLVNVAADLEGWVYEYAADYIEFKPVTVDRIAHETLWKNGQRWLAMSASLGSPEAFVSDLGWSESYATVYAPSTFDKNRRPIYFFPAAYMTKKQELTSWPLMAQAVEETLDIYDDKSILVHTHSRNLTVHLANHLEDVNNGRPIFSYKNPEERKDAITAFEATPGSVLLAMSLDRGYDNSDIDVGIICKVPSPYLGSKQVEKHLYETKNGKLWYANETCKTLVQAYGRVMRSESDSGICVVLDSMFLRFFDQWKRLFPEWFREAVHVNSDFRFEIHSALKQARLSKVPT